MISPRCSNRARCRASRASVLTRSPAGRCSFDGAATTHSIPAADQEPGQPEPRRTGLIDHRHRAAAATAIQARISSRSGVNRRSNTSPVSPIQSTRHNRSCVHIQPNTRTLNLHWGLPHLWLYRPGPSCRQPTFTCERGPSPLIPSRLAARIELRSTPPRSTPARESSRRIQGMVATVDSVGGDESSRLRTFRRGCPSRSVYVGRSLSSSATSAR